VPPELRPLMGTIHQLLERVQGTIIRERRFTDDAAHELRTPLTAVKTHLQVARLAATKTQTIEVMVQALDNADQGVQKLQKTLDQLLLLARLDDKVENDCTERIEARLAARQAIEDVHQVSQDAARRVVLESPDTAADLCIPGTLVVSALRNLLDNALRYSPSTSPVILRLEYPDHLHVCFRVLDEGLGLTEAECILALERFWRRSTDHRGSGLGLSIVSAIAKQYAGKFQLCKNREKGLEARLVIPRHTID